MIHSIFYYLSILAAILNVYTSYLVAPVSKGHAIGGLVFAAFCLLNAKRNANRIEACKTDPCIMCIKKDK